MNASMIKKRIFAFALTFLLATQMFAPGAAMQVLADELGRPLRVLSLWPPRSLRQLPWPQRHRQTPHLLRKPLQRRANQRPQTPFLPRRTHLPRKRQLLLLR